MYKNLMSTPIIELFLTVFTSTAFNQPHHDLVHSSSKTMLQYFTGRRRRRG